LFTYVGINTTTKLYTLLFISLFLTLNYKVLSAYILDHTHKLDRTNLFI